MIPLPVPIASFHFFYCGRGDTILMESAGRWGLLDTNLTADSGADRSIRRHVERHGISHLDFVCVSHPDHDHYNGMKKLLEEKFVTNGRLRVTEFWDSGVAFTTLTALEQRLRGRLIKTEGLRELYGEFLPQFDHQFQHRVMQAGSYNAEMFGDFRVLTLSPTWNTAKRFTTQDVERIRRARVPKLRRCYPNDLSIILVFRHKSLPLNVMFGSDATKNAWKYALEKLSVIDATEEATDPTKFDLVKVSHHGAEGSHSPRLYKSFCHQRKTIAVLSVADGEKHPHPEVVKSLEKWEIETYATCSRRKTSSLPMIGRPESCGDVTVEIDSLGRVSAAPRERCLVAPNVRSASGISPKSPRSG